MSTLLTQEEDQPVVDDQVLVSAFDLDSLVALTTSANSARNAAIQVAVSSNAVTLQPAPRPKSSGARTTTIAIHSTVDGEDVQIYLPQSVFRNCIAEFFPEVRHLPFDPELATLLFESALTDQISTLEDYLGMRIEFRQAEIMLGGQDNDNANIAVDVSWSAQPATRVRISAPDHIAFRIAEAWLANIRSAENNNIELPLTARIGFAEIARDELAQLVPGDVVTLGRAPLRSKEALLIVADTVAAPLSLAGDTPVLANRFIALDGGTSEQAPAASPSGNPGRFITLCADVMRTSIQLATLEDFVVDQPFELPPDMLNAVDLYHEDKKVAQGVVVIAGQTLGILVTRMMHDA